MRPVYYFRDKLAFSRARCEEDQIVTLLDIIWDCVSVHKTDPIEDRRGVDFVATLASGRELLIDAKARDWPCAHHWKNGPELALETWSKMPGGKFHRPDGLSRIGWTLDPEKKAHLILFTFDPRDSTAVFLVPFDHLQMAFTKHRERWAKRYKTGTQESDDWESECIFVPERVVFDAMDAISHGELVLVDRNEPTEVHQISLDEAWDDIPF